jgi:lipopolysaccharide export system protein LptA
LAPDGSTPTALTARDNVQLTIPAEAGAPGRSISAPALDATGAPGRGLTNARFEGGVQFRERGGDVDRTAQSRTLDVSLASGLSEIEEARFAQAVRFLEGRLQASSAQARYVLAKGTLELTGSEPGRTTPQVVDDRISVYGTRIDVTLSGPIVQATGAVKSELKPAKGGSRSEPDAKMPSIFKQDEVVAGTAGELLYDGPASIATYRVAAQVWQGDTRISGDTIALNEKTGDLTAAGSVATAILLEQETSEKQKERVQNTASSSDFHYEDARRRATYLVKARMKGPQGDMTAEKIELYLKESNNEVERLEAYEAVTLRDQNRETTGLRMTYLAAEDRYILTGSPAVMKEECGRQTTGKRVTYDKRTDIVIVDGSEQGRARTSGGTKCP